MIYRNHIWVPIVLTLAGLLPFIGCVLMLMLQIDFIMIYSVRYIFLTYGILIIGFISGIHWGHAIQPPMRQTKLFILSNLITLIGWSALLWPFVIAVLVLAGCFLALLAIDIYLYRNKIIQLWFLKLRVTASIVLLGTLCVAVLS